MAAGSWGVELWDQIDVIVKHSSDQIASTDMLYRLLSDVQKIQHEFGKKLRKVVTSYVPKKKPGLEEPTYNTSIANLIQTLGNAGAIYEKGAKELGDQVVNGMKELYESERKQLDSNRTSSNQLSNSLEHSRKQLDAAWQKYILAYKEKQKAYDNSIKADNDMQLPRAEQMKAKKLYTDKVRLFDQAQGQYADELSKYNTYLRQHYSKGVVQLLEDMQLKDQDRTNRTKDLLSKMCDIRDSMSNQLLEVNRLTREAIATMDPLKDNDFLIRRHKSGELPPVDLPFLNLNSCQASLFDGPIHPLGAYLLGLDPSQPCTQLSASGIGPAGSGTGGGSGGMLGGLKLGKGGREDLNNLRSPFICEISTHGVKETDLTVLQLADRIRELEDCVQKANQEIQGTQRLLDAYRNNPSLGSSKVVEPKIEALRSRTRSLQNLVGQLKDRYAKIGGDQALSEARSRQTVLQAGQADKPAVPTTVQPQVNNFDSEDSDLDDVDVPGPKANIPPPPAADTTDSSSYAGLAVAKYEYAGSGSSYLSTQPGERFHVLQLDTDNTGWTSVISEDGTRQGFVPTSFVDITTF